MDFQEIYLSVISNALTIANIIFWFAVAFVSFHDYMACADKGISNFCWLKIVFIILGLYWTGLYMWVWYATETAYSYDSIMFGRVLIRPVNVFTAAAILAYIIFVAHEDGTFLRFNKSGYSRMKLFFQKKSRSYSLRKKKPNGTDC